MYVVKAKEERKREVISSLLVVFIDGGVFTK